MIGAASTLAVVGTGGYLALTNSANRAWHNDVTAIRKSIEQSPTGTDHASELVRYGVLAANSHNTQAWRFILGNDAIIVEPDFFRRTPNVDPDDHHLFASIGAAVENIVQAAPLLGFSAGARFDPAGDGRVIISLTPSVTANSTLAQAIPRRQVTRSLYEARAVPPADLRMIELAAASDSVAVITLTERSAMDAVGALVIQGNTAQMNDQAYLAELKQWLRFSYADAVSTGDGLFSATSGNPVLPGFLGRLLFPLVANTASENTKYRDQIASSAGLMIFVSRHNDKEHWIAAGRAYQRFALQATALGIKHAFLNQAVEVAAMRHLLADQLSLGTRRPDLIVRFGYAPEMPMSMRRPLSDVIV
ncbi:Acg family FMN-binding oxidoreductase [Devosia sp.]|uniref:Acg family FMN-binding oxidoreductase n=1 Tax=Devosia sp. TaxID=1871048 RepID=UPI003267C228